MDRNPTRRARAARRSSTRLRLRGSTDDSRFLSTTQSIERPRSAARALRASQTTSAYMLGRIRFRVTGSTTPNTSKSTKLSFIGVTIRSARWWASREISVSAPGVSTIRKSQLSVASARARSSDRKSGVGSNRIGSGRATVGAGRSLSA